MVSEKVLVTMTFFLGFFLMECCIIAINDLSVHIIRFLVPLASLIKITYPHSYRSHHNKEENINLMQINSKYYKILPTQTILVSFILLQT